VTGCSKGGQGHLPAGQQQSACVVLESPAAAGGSAAAGGAVRAGAGQLREQLQACDGGEGT
jgi:hypothetical protein